MPDEPQIDERDSVNQGPGCLPAIMASVVLMGMIGFITCAFLTWVLFQQRTEMALRTLRGNVIPQVEQGLMEPVEKKSVVNQLTSFADDLERGKYEDWQAAGVMTRLMIRVPIYQWGEVQAVEAYLNQNQDEPNAESIKQLSRLRRAAELGQANAMDFEDVLQPVRIEDSDGPTGFALKLPLDAVGVAEVVQRAKLVADRAEVPDESFEGIKLDSILRREIESGIREGEI